MSVNQTESASASHSGLPALLDLIEAHREAECSFKAAIDREEEMENQFDRLCQRIDSNSIRIWLQGFPFDVRNIVQSRETLIGCISLDKVDFKRSTNGASISIRKRFDQLFEELRREKLDLFDALAAEVETIRTQSGYAASVECREEMSDRADELLMKICAWPCASIEETRAKGKYLSTRIPDMEGARLKALLASLAGDVDGSADPGQA